MEFSKARPMNHPEMQQIEYYSIATATVYLTEIIFPKKFWQDSVVVFCHFLLAAPAAGGSTHSP